MTRTFTSNIQIQNFLESACEKAVQETAKIVRDKLEQFINEDFYSTYKPLFYDRTYMFLKSPKFNLLDSKTAEVFIDTDVMHYLGISGEDVANLASYGFHGSIDIFRPGFYWTDFINWCDENVRRLIKENLKKQGLQVK
ncbi:hypothetical protein [Lacrimispora indolis]|uniref:hypothetical protein n=1 Tax=Lacrimispora indolis TaxID=69825 RepID=UPI000462E10A|nr:hypothetical protein [[Clostridium] methoxybenzovorans]